MKIESYEVFNGHGQPVTRYNVTGLTLREMRVLAYVQGAAKTDAWPVQYSNAAWDLYAAGEFNKFDDGKIVQNDDIDELQTYDVDALLNLGDTE